MYLDKEKLKSASIEDIVKELKVVDEELFCAEHPLGSSRKYVLQAYSNRLVKEIQTRVDSLKVAEVLSGEDMKNLFKAFDYACYKFYYVIYNRNGLAEQRVKGLLLNYTGGDVVLLSENGIYHIKYRDIIFMKPFAPPMDRLSEEFKNLLNYYMDN